MIYVGDGFIGLCCILYVCVQCVEVVGVFCVDVFEIDDEYCYFVELVYFLLVGLGVIVLVGEQVREVFCVGYYVEYGEFGEWIIVYFCVCGEYDLIEVCLVEVGCFDCGVFIGCGCYDLVQMWICCDCVGECFWIDVGDVEQCVGGVDQFVEGLLCVWCVCVVGVICLVCWFMYWGQECRVVDYFDLRFEFFDYLVQVFLQWYCCDDVQFVVGFGYVDFFFGC